MPRYESPYDPSTMPNSLEHVIYEKKGHVAYVTINRPEARNALHSYAYAELRACWRDIGLDPEVAESEDGAEGPRAFREKRKPVWKMR